MPDLNRLELHLLLALSNRASYGYRLQQQVGDESGGALTPDIGSLYRGLARLMERGWVDEVEEPAAERDTPSPGRRRRWYGLTPVGKEALAREVDRLAQVVHLARERDLSPGPTG